MISEKDSDRYLTPDSIVSIARDLWLEGIGVDPFHDPAGARFSETVLDCRKGLDGHKISWRTVARENGAPATAFVNGPYSLASKNAEKCAREAHRGHMEVMNLCPAAPGSAYWGKWVWPRVDAIAWLGRLSFVAAVDIRTAGGDLVCPAGTAQKGNRTEIALTYQGAEPKAFKALAEPFAARVELTRNRL